VIDYEQAHLLVTYPPKVTLSWLVMLETIFSVRVVAHGWSEGTGGCGGICLAGVVCLHHDVGARCGEGIR